jgi:hypothetical protein
LSTQAGIDAGDDENPQHVNTTDKYESSGAFGAPAFEKGHGRRKFEQPFTPTCVQLSKWRCVGGGGPNIDRVDDEEDDLWTGTYPNTPSRTVFRAAVSSTGVLEVAAGARNCWHIDGDVDTLPVFQDKLHEYKWNSDDDLSAPVSVDKITEKIACASSLELLARSAIGTFNPSNTWSNSIGLGTEVIGADGQGGLLNVLLTNLPSVVSYDGRALTQSTDVDVGFAVIANQDYSVVVKNAETARNSRGNGRGGSTSIKVGTDPGSLTSNVDSINFDPDTNTGESLSTVTVRPYSQISSVGQRYFITVHSPREFRYTKQCTDVASNTQGYTFTCSKSYETFVEDSFNTGYNDYPTSQLNFFTETNVLEASTNDTFVSHANFDFTIESDPLSVGKLMNRHAVYYNDPGFKTATGLEVLDDFSAKTDYVKTIADTNEVNAKTAESNAKTVESNAIANEKGGVNLGDSIFTFALLFFFSIIIGAALMASSCFGLFRPKAPTAPVGAVAKA